MNGLNYQTISFRAFLEGAELDYNAIEALLNALREDEGYESMKGAFLRSNEEFERLAQDRLRTLRFFARYAYETRFEWQEAGIPFEIWLDTCTDIGVWQKTYREESGEIGLAEFDWLTNHVTRKIFKLGRLQFAPDVADEELLGYLLEKKREGKKVPTLKEGERFYFVHIPRGGAMTKEECEKSFSAAAKFFGGRTVFACDSWMLSPALLPLLSPHSNLAAFANRFTLLSVDESSRSAERYLFGKIGEVASYAETTSLQRKAKAYLLTKGALGTALGIFEP